MNATPLTELKRGLTTRHIQFIALGTAIGTGLFLGSATAIQMAGPAVLVAYLLSGAAVFVVMRAMGEMILQDEHPQGSFSTYASRYLGSTVGFVVGWSFTLELLFVSIADVTALAAYLGRWWPTVPPWAWILMAVALVLVLNLTNVKVFGETEFWLSVIKVVAISVMIVAGIVIILTGRQSEAGAAPGLANLWEHGGFAPMGLGGVLMSFTVVVFAFGGIETVGLTAAEAEDPQRAIPRAVNTIPWRVLVFYLGSVGVVLCLAPWTGISQRESTFVQIFDTLGLPHAGDVLNVIVITAAFSALNAITYATGRMIHSLSEQGHAPASFARTSGSGVPFVAIILVGVAMAVALVLNVLIPEVVFQIMAGIASFSVVFVWLVILLTYIAMRRRIQRGELEQRSPFTLPGHQITAGITALFVIFIMVLFGFTPETRQALYVGFATVVALVLAERLFVRRAPAAGTDADPTGPTE